MDEDWLDKLPPAWNRRRLKYVATCNDDVLPENTRPDLSIRYVEISDVSYEKGIEAIEKMDFDSAPSRARRRVRHGDIIVSTVRTYLKAIGRISHPPAGVVVSTGFAVIRSAPHVNPDFLAYVVRSDGFIANIVRNSVGVSYPAIKASELMSIETPVPSLNVQRSIAAFLDSATAKIDALIEKKRRFIELLEEKRAALISQVVTRGLDRAARLKETYNSWFPRIPAHWQTKRLRFAARVTGGHTPDKNRLDYWEQGLIPWVTPKDMKIHILADSEDHVTELAVKEIGLRPVPKDVILIVVRGMILAHSFPVGLTAATVTLNQDMKALHPSKEFHAGYLAWLLRGLGSRTLSLVEESGHGTKALRTELLSNVLLPVPPLAEQISIRDELDASISTLERLHIANQRMMAHLTEYRSALITAAVTGKIDVREEAAKG